MANRSKNSPNSQEIPQAKDSYKSDLEFMRRFFLQSGMELVVGEYTLAGEDLFFFFFILGWEGGR